MKRQYFNVLRVASALAVVLLHSNEGIWTFSHDAYWLEATITFFCLYWAVPCFIMMSGALLIDYSTRYSTKIFLRKRAIKTLIPYIAWCLIGIVYLVFYKVLSIDELSINAVIRMILNNEVLPVYWYLTELFTVYLATPLLTFIPNDKRKVLLEYIIVSMLALNVAIPFFVSSFGLGSVDVQMPLTTLCLFYVAGYYIDRYLPPERFKYIYLLSFGGFMIMLIGTIVASREAESLIQTYMGYTNFPCVIFSIGVFCAFKQIFDLHIRPGRQAYNLIIRVADHFVNETFGIYLVHWYVLNEIKVHLGVNYCDFVYRIPLGFAAFFISWLIVKALRMIPVVKHIVP